MEKALTLLLYHPNGDVITRGSYPKSLLKVWADKNAVNIEDKKKNRTDIKKKNGIYHA
jgi:hypothetical protein